MRFTNKLYQTQLKYFKLIYLDYFNMAKYSKKQKNLSRELSKQNWFKRNKI